MKKFKLENNEIKLGQFVKYVLELPSGGAAKHYLLENDVFLNGELENRRGKRLISGDIVKLEDEEYILK